MRVIMCAEKTREQASDKRIYSHLSSIEHAPFSLSMMYIYVYIYIRVEKSCSVEQKRLKSGLFEILSNRHFPRESFFQR